MTRVLITGAAGGIASAAIAQLQARGAEVVGIDLAASEDGSVIACVVTDQE
jgi:nucleoside-diphosphate-sugar epimerase